MKLQETKRPDGKPVFSIILPIQIVQAKQWTKGKQLKTTFNSKGEVVLNEI